MYRKRGPAILFFLLCFLAALSAEESIATMQKAMDAVFDGSLSAIAGYVAMPRLTLEGVSIEEIRAGLPGKVSFNRADVSKFPEALLRQRQDNLSWYQRLLVSATSTLSPLCKSAAMQIQQRGYEKGSAVLDGTIVMRFDPKSSIANWLDLLLITDWSALHFELELSIIVSGEEFPHPVVFAGCLDAQGEKGQTLVLRGMHLTANGQDIEITPLELAM